MSTSFLLVLVLLLLLLLISSLHIGSAQSVTSTATDFDPIIDPVSLTSGHSGDEYKHPPMLFQSSPSLPSCLTSTATSSPPRPSRLLTSFPGIANNSSSTFDTLIIILAGGSLLFFVIIVMKCHHTSLLCLDHASTIHGSVHLLLLLFLTSCLLPSAVASRASYTPPSPSLVDTRTAPSSIPSSSSSNGWVDSSFFAVAISSHTSPHSAALRCTLDGRCSCQPFIDRTCFSGTLTTPARMRADVVFKACTSISLDFSLQYNHHHTHLPISNTIIITYQPSCCLPRWSDTYYGVCHHSRVFLNAVSSTYISTPTITAASPCIAKRIVGWVLGAVSIATLMMIIMLYQSRHLRPLDQPSYFHFIPHRPSPRQQPCPRAATSGAPSAQLQSAEHKAIPPDQLPTIMCLYLRLDINRSVSTSTASSTPLHQALKLWSSSIPECNVAGVQLLFNGHLIDRRRTFSELNIADGDFITLRLPGLCGGSSKGGPPASGSRRNQPARSSHQPSRITNAHSPSAAAGTATAPVSSSSSSSLTASATMENCSKENWGKLVSTANELGGQWDDGSSSLTEEQWRAKITDHSPRLYDRPMCGDGNCLLRAAAYHIHKDPERHGELRKEVVNYLRENRNSKTIGAVAALHVESSAIGMRVRSTNLPGTYTTIREFDEYLAHISQDGAWASIVELQCLANIHKVDFHVLSRKIPRRATDDTTYKFTAEMSAEERAAKPPLIHYIASVPNHFNALSIRAIDSSPSLTLSPTPARSTVGPQFPYLKESSIPAAIAADKHNAPFVNNSTPTVLDVHTLPLHPPSHNFHHSLSDAFGTPTHRDAHERGQSDNMLLYNELELMEREKQRQAESNEHGVAQPLTISPAAGALSGVRSDGSTPPLSQCDSPDPDWPPKRTPMIIIPEPENEIESWIETDDNETINGGSDSQSLLCRESVWRACFQRMIHTRRHIKELKELIHIFEWTCAVRAHHGFSGTEKNWAAQYTLCAPIIRPQNRAAEMRDPAVDRAQAWPAPASSTVSFSDDRVVLIPNDLVPPHPRDVLLSYLSPSLPGVWSNAQPAIVILLPQRNTNNKNAANNELAWKGLKPERTPAIAHGKRSEASWIWNTSQLHWAAPPMLPLPFHDSARPDDPIHLTRDQPILCSLIIGIMTPVLDGDINGKEFMLVWNRIAPKIEAPQPQQPVPVHAHYQVIDDSHAAFFIPGSVKAVSGMSGAARAPSLTPRTREREQERARVKERETDLLSKLRQCGARAQCKAEVAEDLARHLKHLQEEPVKKLFQQFLLSFLQFHPSVQSNSDRLLQFPSFKVYDRRPSKEHDNEQQHMFFMPVENSWQLRNTINKLYHNSDYLWTFLLTDRSVDTVWMHVFSYVQRVLHLRIQHCYLGELASMPKPDDMRQRFEMLRNADGDSTQPEIQKNCAAIRGEWDRWVNIAVKRYHSVGAGRCTLYIEGGLLAQMLQVNIGEFTAPQPEEAGGYEQTPAHPDDEPVRRYACLNYDAECTFHPTSILQTLIPSVSLLRYGAPLSEVESTSSDARFEDAYLYGVLLLPELLPISTLVQGVLLSEIRRGYDLHYLSKEARNRKSTVHHDGKLHELLTHMSQLYPAGWKMDHNGDRLVELPLGQHDSSVHDDVHVSLHGSVVSLTALPHHDDHPLEAMYPLPVFVNAVKNSTQTSLPSLSRRLLRAVGFVGGNSDLTRIENGLSDALSLWDLLLFEQDLAVQHSRLPIDDFIACIVRLHFHLHSLSGRSIVGYLKHRLQGKLFWVFAEYGIAEMIINYGWTNKGLVEKKNFPPIIMNIFHAARCSMNSPASAKLAIQSDASLSSDLEICSLSRFHSSPALSELAAISVLQNVFYTEIKMFQQDPITKRVALYFISKPMANFQDLTIELLESVRANIKATNEQAFNKLEFLRLTLFGLFLPFSWLFCSCLMGVPNWKNFSGWLFHGSLDNMTTREWMPPIDIRNRPNGYILVGGGTTMYLLVMFNAIVYLLSDPRSSSLTFYEGFFPLCSYVFIVLLVAITGGVRNSSFLSHVKLRGIRGDLRVLHHIHRCDKLKGAVMDSNGEAVLDDDVLQNDKSHRQREQERIMSKEDNPYNNTLLNTSDDSSCWMRELLSFGGLFQQVPSWSWRISMFLVASIQVALPWIMKDRWASACSRSRSSPSSPSPIGVSDAVLSHCDEWAAADRSNSIHTRLEMGASIIYAFTSLLLFLYISLRILCLRSELSRLMHLHARLLTIFGSTPFRTAGMNNTELESGTNFINRDTKHTIHLLAPDHVVCYSYLRRFLLTASQSGVDMMTFRLGLFVLLCVTVILVIAVMAATGSITIEKVSFLDLVSPILGLLVIFFFSLVCVFCVDSAAAMNGMLMRHRELVGKALADISFKLDELSTLQQQWAWIELLQDNGKDIKGKQRGMIAKQSTVKKMVEQPTPTTKPKDILVPMTPQSITVKRSLTLNSSASRVSHRSVGRSPQPAPDIVRNVVSSVAPQLDVECVDGINRPMSRMRLELRMHASNIRQVQRDDQLSMHQLERTRRMLNGIHLSLQHANKLINFLGVPISPEFRSVLAGYAVALITAAGTLLFSNIQRHWTPT